MESYTNIQTESSQICPKLDLGNEIQKKHYKKECMLFLRGRHSNDEKYVVAVKMQMAPDFMAP